MRRFTLTALQPVALAILLSSTSVQAQSLQALIQTAQSYDAAVLAAQAQIKAAEFRVQQSQALNQPGVSLTSGSAQRPNLVWQDPSSSPKDMVQINADLTLGAKLPLINKGNAATQAQSLRALEIAQADLKNVSMDLSLRVSQAYFDVLAAQNAVTTAQASKKAIAEQLASAQRNFEVGTATITDAREAQARFDLASAQEIAAQNDLQVKRVALDQLVGKSGITPHASLKDTSLPAPETQDAEAWVASANQQHPQLQKAQLAVDVARLESDKARASNSYTLDAVASAAYSATNTSAATSLTTNTKSAGIGLVFNLPLYTGGANENRLKETLVLEDKARHDLDAARRTISQATRQVYFGLQSLNAQVKALEAAESSSKLALEATQLGYKVGVRVNLDVLNAQTQLFTTQRDLAKARYDVLLNYLRLRQTSGGLSDRDISEVSDRLLP